jgi:hypothetical protein
MAKEAKNKTPSFPFYPHDALADIAPLDASARGVWMTFLLHAHNSEVRGKVTLRLGAWCRMCGCDIEVMKEALVSICETGIGDILVNDEKCDMSRAVTFLSLESHANVTLINRRMYRDAVSKLKSKEDNRLRKAKERAKNKCHADVTDVEGTENTLPSSSFPSPSSFPKNNSIRKSTVIHRLGRSEEEGKTVFEFLELKEVFAKLKWKSYKPLLEAARKAERGVEPFAAMLWDKFRVGMDNPCGAAIEAFRAGHWPSERAISVITSAMKRSRERESKVFMEAFA